MWRWRRHKYFLSASIKAHSFVVVFVSFLICESINNHSRIINKRIRNIFIRPRSQRSKHGYFMVPWSSRCRFILPKKSRIPKKRSKKMGTVAPSLETAASQKLKVIPDPSLPSASPVIGNVTLNRKIGDIFEDSHREVSGRFLRFLFLRFG